VKFFLCWLLGMGHEDKPYQFVILKDKRKIVYNYKCTRCGRVRWYNR
jgi:ribosomal protein L44E